MAMRLIRPFIFLMLIVHNFGANATPTDKIATLNHTTLVSITKLIAKVKRDFQRDTALLLTIAELNDMASSLYDKLEQENPDGAVTDSLFGESLRNAQQTIDYLSFCNSSDTIRSVSACLTKDYEAKFRANSHSSISVTTTSIKLNIQVQSNGTFKEGYDVQCNYMWDANLKARKFKANQPTNHALIILSPGYYIFYVLKDNVVVKTRDVQIGGEYLNNPLIINL